MNKVFVLLAIISLIISCKKDNEDKFLTSIKAGQTDGIGIKYVDFEPDKKLVVIPSDDYSYSTKLFLDMNNDSIHDFELRYEFPPDLSCCYSRNSIILPLGENSVCVSKTITNGWTNTFVQSLALGDSIGSRSNWSNSKEYLYSYRHSKHTTPEGGDLIQESIGGYWYDHDNIYVGVKIVKDGKDFFGWIDVKMKGQEVRGYAVSVPY